jgi:hypothetical protein
MTYPVWPAVPYKPLLDSWSKPDMYQEPRVTDMEGGNKRMLTRPGDDVQRISFVIMMTKAQFATFETFVLTTLGRGTSRFTMDVWNGSAMETNVVQFASKPTPTTNHPVVNVSMDLFIFPRLTP